MHRIAVIGAKGFPGFGGAARANENIINRLRFFFIIYLIYFQLSLST